MRNPPYKGTSNQSDEQKDDLTSVFDSSLTTYRSLDYVAAWFFKAAMYSKHTKTFTAFVSTNSICQGGPVPFLWPAVFSSGNEILFAHTSFLWRNLAAHNAGVTVAVVGFGPNRGSAKRLYSVEKDGSVSMREVGNINAYLVAGPNVIAEGRSSSVSSFPRMMLGNQPYEGNNLILESDEFSELTENQLARFTRKLYGSSEYIRGGRRRCLWIMDENLAEARDIPALSERIERTKKWRFSVVFQFEIWRG